jgi:hypothetical protein
MKDFLRQRGASADAIQYMLGDYEEIAALDYIRDENSHVGQPKSKVRAVTTNFLVRSQRS